MKIPSTSINLTSDENMQTCVAEGQDGAVDGGYDAHAPTEVCLGPRSLRRRPFCARHRPGHSTSSSGKAIASLRSLVGVLEALREVEEAR